jgi:hypothetical protein
MTTNNRNLWIRAYILPTAFIDTLE